MTKTSWFCRVGIWTVFWPICVKILLKLTNKVQNSWKRFNFPLKDEEIVFLATASKTQVNRPGSFINPLQNMVSSWIDFHFLRLHIGKKKEFDLVPFSNSFFRRKNLYRNIDTGTKNLSFINESLTRAMQNSSELRT